MNYKLLLLATLAAFIYLIVVNAALFPVFFPDGPPDRYENLRPAPLVQYHLLALLITAFLMAFLYQILFRGGPWWREGLKAGVVMALFVSVPMGLHAYAMINTSFLVMMAPALWVTVIWGIAGIVIGFVHRGTFRASEFKL